MEPRERLLRRFESHLTSYLTLPRETFEGPDVEEALAAHAAGRRPGWA